METLAVPMFPLGSVLLPGMLLPLRVFEPRYQRLTRDVMDTDQRFGVVLIERGHEVGGGDVRTDVGTMAQILQAEPRSDGRWTLITVGVERFRVIRWREDDPYPRAELEPWPDPHVTVPDGRVDAVRARLHEVLALARRLGEPVPEDDVAAMVTAEDPVTASYRATAVAPIGPLDRYRLLQAADAAERLDALDDHLAQLAEVFRFRLS